MNASFPQKEVEMYPIIRDYFLTKVKCDHVFVDGDEAFVRLERNLHTGEVDLAALRDPDGKSSPIHLVEAKCLTKRQSFEECFSQIDAVRDSGERLWVSLPEAQWKSLTQTDRQRNQKRLNDFHFGLLLVTPEQCYAEIPAPLNPEVTESGRTEVLRQLGFAVSPLLPDVSSLGRAESQQAAGIMALTGMVAEILYEVEKKRVVFHRHWDSLYDDDFVTNGWFVPTVELSGPIYCELDPFGRYLQDGVPSAWVSVNVPIEDILVSLERDFRFGTHVYLDGGEWQWKMVPMADGSQAIRYWVDKGLDEIASLCVRIEIVGRMKSALKSDLERVISEGRQFLSVRTAKPKRAAKKANRTSR